MEFKVGDKVRVVEMSYLSGIPIGTVGTVVDVDDVCGGLYEVKSKNKSWWYCGYKLKLIKRCPKNTKPTKPTTQIKRIISRHISNKEKMMLIAEVVEKSNSK